MRNRLRRTTITAVDIHLLVHLPDRTETPGDGMEALFKIRLPDERIALGIDALHTQPAHELHILGNRIHVLQIQRRSIDDDLRSFLKTDILAEPDIGIHQRHGGQCGNHARLAAVAYLIRALDQATDHQPILPPEHLMVEGQVQPVSQHQIVPVDQEKIIPVHQARHGIERVAFRIAPFQILGRCVCLVAEAKILVRLQIENQPSEAVGRTGEIVLDVVVGSPCPRIDARIDQTIRCGVNLADFRDPILVDHAIVNQRRAVVAVRAVFQQRALSSERGDGADLPYQRGGECVELAFIPIHVALGRLAACIET